MKKKIPIAMRIFRWHLINRPESTCDCADNDGGGDDDDDDDDGMIW